jgi:predicted permease
VSWLSRLANVARRSRLDRDLDEEIRFHLEARAEELVKAGLSPAEARTRARLQFGNPLLLRESSRDIKSILPLDSIVRDIGYGVRLCRRHKIVTATAILSLSLAIGACTAAFSLIDALILRPLPVDDPQTLIYLGVRGPGDTQDGLSFNYPLFGDLRAAGRPFVSLFALSDQDPEDAAFDDGGEPEKVYAQWISGDALPVLGVSPAAGRLLAAADDEQPGQHPVAVLSHDFWMRRFGRSPDVLGRWVTIRGKALQIVGVAQQGFTGVEPGIRTDLWAPTMMWDDQAISDPHMRWFRVWGRVHRGVEREQVQTVLQTVLTRFLREQAAARPQESRERLEQIVAARLNLRSAAKGPSALRNDFARALSMLAGVTLLVLLIASSNVASLLIARAAARQREMALRVAIGAGRGRLVQQVLVESGLLALASCVLGALLAMATAPRIVTLLSTSRTPVHLDVQVDWRLLIFLAGAGTLITCLFGLVPAMRASAVSPGDALKSGTGRQTARLGAFRPLVAAQVAFCVVVLVVAGLCLTSFVKLLRSGIGFDQHGLALVSVAPAPNAPVPERAEQLARWRRVLDEIVLIPEIDSASVSGWGLFEGSGRNKSVRVPNRAPDAYRPWYLPVSPGFLETMRIPLLAGRDFDWRDGQPDRPSAVIVNASFARRYFPGQSPVGRRFFRIDGGTTLVPQEIVGLAGDAKYTSLREAAPPTVYDLSPFEDQAVVQVRTRLEARAVADVLRQQLARTYPAMRVRDVTLQSTLVENTIVRDRVLALLSAFFSAVALLLVVVGLYGVLSYGVVRRTREIGIRRALGAQPLAVVALVLSDVLAMTAAGVLVGTAVAAFAVRFITEVLFDVRALNPGIAAGPLALLVACTLAALVPAWRAIRIEPTTALRDE